MERANEIANTPNVTKGVYMVPTAQIKIGYRIGHLKVESATGNRKNGYMVWNCRCDCGNIIQLDTRTLQRRTVRDCGCITKVTPGVKDLTGQRFGKLVCLEVTQQRGKSGGVIWRCRCDCGNICLAISTQLTQGYKKSCGCMGHPPLKDFVGKRFGMLTVTEYVGKRAGMHRWKCICDCGNETVVGQTLLQTGKTKSCGCLQTNIIRENLKLCEGTSVALLEANKKRLISSNRSGYTGVYKSEKSNKWCAQIGFKGKTYYLGSFDCLEDAVAARKQGEKMHDDFLKWYYSEHLKQKNF